VRSFKLRQCIQRRRSNGKKLYELARRGVEVERDAVKVTIKKLELLQHDDRKSQIRLRVICSAGTYIRTLAEDIGREIGTGAHLRELRRTRAGRFGLEDAITLSELEELDDPTSPVRPASDAVTQLPYITLSPDRVERTKSGLATRTDDPFQDGSAVKMVGSGGELIAIGIYDSQEKSVKPKIVLV
jgi:tRNA pseudouridine55 synthase